MPEIPPLPTRSELEQEALLWQGKKAEHERLVEIARDNIAQIRGQLYRLEHEQALAEQGGPDNGRPDEVAAYVGDARGEDSRTPADGEGLSNSDGEAGDAAVQEPYSESGGVVELDS